MTIITRFAPSPSGLLHLGHAYAAIYAAKCANGSSDRFLLRIEDIDQSRCNLSFEKSIFHDLSWLGLDWESPVRRQSEHFDDYDDALQKLEVAGFVYPCFCTRKEILHEVIAAGNAPHGNDTVIYPGTCKNLGKSEQEELISSGKPYAFRLNMKKAVEYTGRLAWHDRIKGKQIARPEIFGDIIVARKEFSTSYHLAVTIDDHLQGISLITRGNDLFDSSHIHRLLQALLNLDSPCYEHHRLITTPIGRRIAKRDKTNRLADLRERGMSPMDIYKMIELTPW